MKQPVWAIILGNFRQEFELYTTIAYLCELREHSVIDGILLSTWIGEADKIDGFRGKLHTLGVELVETSPLDENTGYTSLNYLRQSTQMKSALAALPANALVLKCRSDFSNFDLNRIDGLQKELHLRDIDSFGALDTGFEKKVQVLRYGVTSPFTFHDVTYIGRKEELRKICTLDNSLLSVGSVMWVDIWLFAPYFASRFPIIEDFFRYIENDEYRGLMMQLNHDKAFYLPAALNKFYALYFAILYQCFSIYHNEPYPDEEELTLEDIFYGKEGQYLRKSWLVEIRNEEIIRKIVCGELKHTKAFDDLLSELEKIKEFGYAETMEFTAEDYAELVDWGRDFLGVEPGQWLKPWKKAEVHDRCRQGFQESAQVLFSQYHPDGEVLKALDEISHDQTSYYGTVIQNLKLFQGRDKGLYKKALFNASRYADEEVIDRIADLLLEGDLSPAEREEALYPFVRYGKEDRLYHYPLTKTRIRGLMKYCLFEEREGLDTGIRKTWFDGIVNYYGLNETASLSEDDITVEKLRNVLRKALGEESIYE